MITNRCSALGFAGLNTKCVGMKQTHDLTIVFDTDCLMCSAWVGFILRHERAPSARFMSAWSDAGLALAARHQLSPKDLDATYLVVAGGAPLTKSDATLAIFQRLHAPWRWAVVFRVLPKGVRDWFYDRMAKNRYRLFGQQDQCFVPPEGQQDRFTLGPPRSAAMPDHR